MEYWIGWLFLSISLTLIMEMIKFQSIIKTFNFVRKRPGYFAINLLIVSATLVFSFFVSRKLFFIGFMTFFWLFLAIMNAIVTHLRGYPLMFSDIFLIKEGLSLSSHYFKPWVIALIIAGIAIILHIGYGWYQIQYSVKSLDYLLASIYVTLAAFIFNRIEKGQPVESSSVEDEEIGFAYAMADSIYPYLNRKPDTYNEEMMTQILKGITYYPSKGPVHRPQIILLQLESFFDPLRLEGVAFSQDPIPTFRKLMQQKKSGVMRVPTFGGGTAKTEFSILTSMNAELLKPGEIPHHSFLKHTPVESLASQLERMGYCSTLIHNYEGNFYNRHLAYENLGFSRYIPIEYMSGVGIPHDLSQMNDEDLVDYVLKTLVTDQSAFIYGITAGTHQPYDETPDDHPLIQVEGPMSIEMKYALQDYAKRIYQLDQEIHRLIQELQASEQEVILMMFADHLPNLPILNDESMYPYNPYEVPYFISHFHPSFDYPLPKQLECYQLGTWLMKTLNIPLSMMQQLHITYKDHECYQDILRLSQYDQLEGKAYLTNQVFTTHQTTLHFGLNEQRLEDYHWTEAGLIVYGAGFNIDSQLYVDQRKVETIFISDTELLAAIECKTFDTLTLKQLSRRHEVLGDEINLIAEHETVIDKGN